MKVGLLLLILAFWCSAQATEIAARRFNNGSEVRLLAPLNGLPSGGFFAVRFEIENEGKKNLSLQLNASCIMNDSGGFGIRSLRRRSNDQGEIESVFKASCPPKESRSFDFLIPISQDYRGNNRYLDITVVDAETGQFWCNGDVQTLASPLDQDFVISNSISKMKHFISLTPSGGPVFDPAFLPGDWRAYSGFDALIMTKADLQSIAPGSKVALDQWVRSGGHLVIYEGGDLSSGNRPEDGSKRGRPARKKAGSGRGSRQELIDSLDQRQDGFGLRTFIEKGRLDWDPGGLFAILDQEPYPLSAIHTEQYIHLDWPVGDELGSRSLGTGLVLFGLMIFAVVVGPINLFVWAKATRRHRLFFTTPVISLAASLIMVGMIILSDGFGGEGARAIAIEVGSPGDKTAVIVQEQFSRSGILFSSSFDLDDQSVLNPIRPPVTDMNRADSPSSTGTFRLQVSSEEDGWKYSGDLFESRSEQGQLIRSVIPSREGLSLVSRPGETPKLTSSFPYALGPVFFTDAEGKIWSVDTIAPGESATLRESDIEKRSLGLDQAVSRFGESYQLVLQQMLQRKDSFAALAEEAPGVETHPSIDWRKSPVVITGLTRP